MQVMIDYWWGKYTCTLCSVSRLRHNNDLIIQKNFTQNKISYKTYISHFLDLEN